MKFIWMSVGNVNIPNIIIIITSMFDITMLTLSALNDRRKWAKKQNFRIKLSIKRQALINLYDCKKELGALTWGSLHRFNSKPSTILGHSIIADLTVQIEYESI